MTVAKSFTFFSNATNDLFWVVTDAAGTVINNAVVVANLYWGRDRLKPDQVPGTAVPGFTAVSLPFSGPDSQYKATIAALTNVPNGGNYILVVNVKDSNNNQIAHWERPAVVIESGP